MATETSIKLFLRDCNKTSYGDPESLKGGNKAIHIEVMVYDNGALSGDPRGPNQEAGWSRSTLPGCPPGLEGTPNEIKLKYIWDSHSGDSCS